MKLALGRQTSVLYRVLPFIIKGQLRLFGLGLDLCRWFFRVGVLYDVKNNSVREFGDRKREGV